MNCTCEKCVAACRKMPGRFLPLEALRAIRAGHADRMMLVNYHKSRGPTVATLWPLSAPDPKQNRPSLRFCRDSWDAHGQCTFLADGLCSIHHSGFKPTECREAQLCRENKLTRAQQDEKIEGYAQGWDTFVGLAIVQIWQRELARRNTETTDARRSN